MRARWPSSSTSCGARQGADGVSCAPRGSSLAPDPPLPARDLAGAAAALQVPPDVLGVRGAGDRGFGILRGLVLAGVAAAALQPVQPRRLRPRRAQTLFRRRLRRPARHTPRPDVFANVLQPLIDFFEAILVFFHDTVGLSWGLSIVALTVARARGAAPADAQAVQVDAGMVRLQPEIKKLQEKYKDDSERLNQEMMKFYRENKVNPFASCLPLVAQLPVFLSLFYMLQDDLRLDICPDDQPAGHARTRSPAAPAAPRVPLHPGPDGQGHGRRAGRADRALRRLAAALDAADVDGDGPDAAHDHHRAAVRLRALRHQLPGRPARLLDHDEPLDDRAAGASCGSASGRCGRRRRTASRPPMSIMDRMLHGGGRQRPTRRAPSAPAARRGQRRAASARPRAEGARPAAPPRRRRARRRSDRDGADERRRRRRRERSASCSSTSSTRWASTPRSRSTEDGERDPRRARTATTSGCSSAATARRSTPCSTWRSRSPAPGQPPAPRVVSTPRATASAARQALQRQADQAAADARARAAARWRSTR